MKDITPVTEAARRARAMLDEVFEQEMLEAMGVRNPVRKDHRVTLTTSGGALVASMSVSPEMMASMGSEEVVERWVRGEMERAHAAHMDNLIVNGLR